MMQDVDELVNHYLRQKDKHKDGTPGTYSLRFLVWPTFEGQKPKRVEIGLGTDNREVAIYAARVLVLAIYALGGRFSGRLALLGTQREVARIPDVLPKGRKKGPSVLPPAREVDDEQPAE